MTVYRNNPLLMTVMGANPGGPAFIVIDSVTGRVMYTKRATGMGSEAINSCALAAQRFALKTGHSQIVYLDLSRARVGETRSVAMARVMGITEEVHPDGTVTRNNPPVRRRRAPDDAIDKAIGHAWAQFMSGVQVPIMDIPRIFRDIKLEMAGGATLELAVTAVGQRYRVNRNPGLGAAVMAGVAGAVTTRMLSNPKKRQYMSICQSCVYGTHPMMLTGYSLRNEKCDRCGRYSDLAMVDMSRTPVVGGYKTRRYKPNTPASNPRSGSVLITTPSQLEAGKVASWLRREKVDARVDVHRGEWGVFVPPNQFGRARHALNLVLSKNPSKGRGTKNWAVEVIADSSGQWTGNAMRFATKEAAEAYASDLYSRWTAVKETRVVESTNPANKVRKNYKTNSGGARKTTMSIAQFAQLVKKQNDPALWRDFVAKCRAYHKWSHGTWPTKVAVERVNKPGMKGMWITFAMGRQPESTYVMPDGTKRKGAWKHKWDRMPQMTGDPQAGFILTKLGAGNKLTDFLHG